MRQTSSLCRGGLPRGRGKVVRTAGSSADLGFEAQLWAAANALRGSMDAADCEHAVLGLIFLKYISDAFEEHRKKLLAEPYADPDGYRAENIFWMPSEARWSERNGRFRDPPGQVLFIYACKLGRMLHRLHWELTNEAIAKISGIYQSWRGEGGAHRNAPLPEYRDVPGFCKSATLDVIRKHGHVLTPRRYVGAEAAPDDGDPFEEKKARLVAQLREQQAEAAKLDAAIAPNLKELGYEL